VVVVILLTNYSIMMIVVLGRVVGGMSVERIFHPSNVQPHILLILTAVSVPHVDIVMPVINRPIYKDGRSIHVSLLVLTKRSIYLKLRPYYHGPLPSLSTVMVTHLSAPLSAFLALFSQSKHYCDNSFASVIPRKTCVHMLKNRCCDRSN
jgi:hypothetical protein